MNADNYTILNMKNDLIKILLFIVATVVGLILTIFGFYTFSESESILFPTDAIQR